MTELLEVLKYTVPSLVVLLTAFLILKRFVEFNNKNLEVLKQLTEQHKNNSAAGLSEKEKDNIVTLRLQAYERIVLFLERINPLNLVVREMEPGLTAAQFHKKLLNVIHQEFEHNITQQIYLSDEVWEMVKNAKEEIMSLINASMREVKPDDKALTLGEIILSKSVEQDNDVVSKTISALKAEMNSLFRK
jgi:hypothetical protein